MMEYIPCLDNVETVKRLKSMKKGEKFERHCPEKDKELNCFVPAPKGYKAPNPWSRSRDEMIPEIAFAHHTRVILDVGCGVAGSGRKNGDDAGDVDCCDGVIGDEREERGRNMILVAEKTREKMGVGWGWV
ncbi:putative S-adenosyl-L-methionine-dependent methyltransferase [Helianthus anomalus]